MDIEIGSIRLFGPNIKLKKKKKQEPIYNKFLIFLSIRDAIRLVWDG